MTRPFLPTPRYIAALLVVYGSVPIFVVIAVILVTGAYAYPLLSLGVIIGAVLGYLFRMFTYQIQIFAMEMRRALSRALKSAHQNS
jgi:hypothetical protein